MARSPVWFKLSYVGIGALTAHMAWGNIEDYSVMATIQLGRIQDNSQFEALISQIDNSWIAEAGLSPDEYQGVRDFQLARLTADAHFYLNCWRIVALNAFRIAKVIPDARLDQFLVDQQCTIKKKDRGLNFDNATQSVTLGWYAQGRDHFEHIDERIFGGARWEKLKVDSSRIHPRKGHEDLARDDAMYFSPPFFDGTHMVVGESAWEITPTVHNQLTGLVKQLHRIGEDILAEQESGGSA